MSEHTNVVIACRIAHRLPLRARAARTPDTRCGSLRGLVCFLWLGILLLSFVLSACGEPSASCNAPPVTFAPPAVTADHQEVVVHFTCEGAVQAGTLYLPAGPGPHPAVIWIHGAGEARRLGWGAPLVSSFVQSGVAVFSFDKRGVGESQGTCCPGDKGQFNLLTADVVGAVVALASRSDIDNKHIGLIGASQAGWIAPKVAVIAPHVAFVALASATPLTERQTNLYERLAGGEQGKLSKAEISQRLKDNGPSGFDPLPDLKQVSAPSLWLFGSEDDRVPVDESVAVLKGLKAEGKAITIEVFEGAGHGLLDVPPSDPKALPTMVSWIMKQVH